MTENKQKLLVILWSLVLSYQDMLSDAIEDPDADADEVRESASDLVEALQNYNAALAK